ncbi:hypothetical protein [Methylobacter sp. S3L5C]|uniref:hypothetical protein n=1 Tax=Methylobacter sp. S3L5C TaxID=2839024 RepID=UPI001FAD8F6B|nr:hypothetical protein [Methylobacter sp. S3L5C]UOA07112.1 hypothetical protein KKZ03_12385 [Methylobacter sp. S3L5C]
MVDLAKITKDDAKEAAIKFLGILAMWTDCLFDGKAGARLLNIDQLGYEGGDIHYDGSTEALESYILSSNLAEAVFVTKIEQIFEFAKWGTGSIKNELGDHLIDGNHLIDLLTEFGSFRNVFERKSGRRLGQTTLPFLPFKDDGVNNLEVFNIKGNLILDILLTITDAAYARWKLTDYHQLTLEEIALLAGVGIKTVRNAVSSKGHDRLVIAAGEKYIDHDEAYRWLLTKKGFTGPFSYDAEPSYESYETLGQFRHHCFVLRKLANLEITDLSKSMGWDELLTDAYTNLENLVATESLELLTPVLLMALGNFYQSLYLTTFVVEGSKILASVVAELRAKTLFN